MLGTILGILWVILKIILWIILGLLGLLLLLVLMILLVPIRYQLEGSKYETIDAIGKITYLLRLIRVTFEYSPEGYAYKVKVLFFTVLKESVQFTKAADESVEENTEQPTVEAKEAATPVPEVSQTTAVKPGNQQTETVKPKETTDVEAAAETQRVDVVNAGTPGTEEAKKKSKKKKAPKQKKAKKEGESALDQFKRYYAFLREDHNRGVLKFVLGRLFWAIGSIFPKKFYGRVHFGLEDPALTAYILGSVSVFYHKYKDSLTVSADFENQVIEGEVRIKGRIIPGIFVWTLIRIYLDPRVRRLIKEIRGKKVKKKKAVKTASRLL